MSRPTHDETHNTAEASWNAVTSKPSEEQLRATGPTPVAILSSRRQDGIPTRHGPACLAYTDRRSQNHRHVKLGICTTCFCAGATGMQCIPCQTNRGVMSWHTALTEGRREINPIMVVERLNTEVRVFSAFEYEETLFNEHFEAPLMLDNDGNPVDIPPDSDDDSDNQNYDIHLSEPWSARMQRFLENPSLFHENNTRTLAGRPSRRRRTS